MITTAHILSLLLVFYVYFTDVKTEALEKKKET